MRYGVPVAVAGVAAATIGLVPALAGCGDPDLPKITAQELISKIAASDTQQLSGTVKVNTDLGLPSLPGARRPGAGGSGGAHGRREGRDGASAAPEAKLMELAVRRAHAAGRGRRPRQAAGVDPRGRRRVQPDPQRRRGLGVRQRAATPPCHTTAPDGAGDGKRGTGAEASPKDLPDATPQELAKQMR